MPEEWLQYVSGLAGSPVAQYAAIFAVIFLALGACVLVIRRLARPGAAPDRVSGERGRQPRLGIVDVYELDRQRNLILLRRDNVEHLLLVGGPNDVVIESGIERLSAFRPTPPENALEGRPTRIGARIEPSFPAASLSGPEAIPGVSPPPKPDDPARPKEPEARAPAPSAPSPSVETPDRPGLGAGRRRLDEGTLADLGRQLEATLAASTPPADTVGEGRERDDPERGPPPLLGPDADAARTKPGGTDQKMPLKNPFSVEEIEVEFARLLGRPIGKRG